MIPLRTHIWIYWIFLAQGISVYFIVPQIRPYIFYIVGLSIFQRPFNLVFPVTYGCSILLFLFAFFKLRPLTHSWGKALVLSFAYPFAAVSLFEQTFQTIGFLVLPGWGAASVSLLAWLINGSSILMIFSSLPYWKINWRFVLSLAGFAFVFVLWVALGFPQLSGPTPELAFSFNVPAKIMAFLVFASLIRGRLKIAQVISSTNTLVTTRN